MENITQDIELLIIKDIVTRKYRIGEKLPKQTELVNTYNASKNTIQKVMTNLVKLGVVTVRKDKNKGYIVPPNSTAGLELVKRLSDCIKEVELFLRDINFTNREINTLLRIKKLTYEIPQKLYEKEKQRMLRVGLAELEKTNNQLQVNELDDIDKLLNSISISDDDFQPIITIGNMQELLQNRLL